MRLRRAGGQPSLPSSGSHCGRRDTVIFRHSCVFHCKKMEPAYFWQTAHMWPFLHEHQSAGLISQISEEQKTRPKFSQKMSRNPRMAQKIQPAHGLQKSEWGRLEDGGSSFPNLSVIPPKWNQTS